MQDKVVIIQIGNTTYVYKTAYECIKENGDRHKANGDEYLERGLIKHAAGSYQKAARNYERAYRLQPIKMEWLGLCSIDELGNTIAKGILNGNNS